MRDLIRDVITYKSLCLKLRYLFKIIVNDKIKKRKSAWANQGLIFDYKRTKVPELTTGVQLTIMINPFFSFKIQHCTIDEHMLRPSPFYSFALFYFAL